MNENGDRLSLAFNTFFADLFVAPSSEQELNFRMVIAGKGSPPAEAFATIQLVLHPGESLQTARRTLEALCRAAQPGTGRDRRLDTASWLETVCRSCGSPRLAHLPLQSIPERSGEDSRSRSRLFIGPSEAEVSSRALRQTQGAGDYIQADCGMRRNGRET